MSAGEFEATAPDGVVLRGTRDGKGAPLVLAHGLTAHRELVVHGSRALSRAGFDLIRYDARAHGQSDAGDEGSRTYEHLADDMEAVVGATVLQGRRPVVAGHSMGAHTLVAHALRDPDAVAGIVVIGPAVVGTPPDEESLRNWDALADGLARDGADGFIEVYSRDLDPDWRDTLIRARDRLGKHRDLDALAGALREVPRSIPFGGIAELEGLDVPALVVASHDEADPGHPHSVAEAYAEALPQARLIAEEPGESPLAWQGGRLSREIAAFCEEEAVRERMET